MLLRNAKGLPLLSQVTGALISARPQHIATQRLHTRNARTPPPLSRDVCHMRAGGPGRPPQG